MKSPLLYLKTITVIFVFSALTACGGGGGDGGGGGAPYTVSTQSVSFTATKDGVRPASKIVNVTVTSGVVYLDVTSNSSYFDASLTITGTTTGEIRITPASPTMAAGQYNGTVTVKGCSDQLCNLPVSGSPLTIDVSYFINTVSSDKSSLNFSLVEGSGSDTKPITLDFSGTNSSWSASVTQVSGTTGWWSLSASSGSTFPAQIDVTANVSSIPVGTHTANLNLTAGGSTITVPLTLLVNAKGVNFVSPYVATTNTAGDVIIRGHGFQFLTNPTVSFGSNSATSFNVVSDSEIRATYPALVAGSYNIEVSDTTTTLTSNATLVVKDVPAFSYSAINLTNSASQVIFDSEREAIYFTEPATDTVKRYTHNGTNWGLASTWTTGVSTTSCCSITMSTDGSTLYIARNNLLYPVDLNTNTRGTAIDVFPFSRSMSRMGTLNDGSLLITSSFNNYLFKYDTISGTLLPVSTDFRYANSIVVPSADGSRVLTPYASLGTITEPLTYYDASSDNLVSNALETSNLNSASIDRTGTRSIFWHDGAIDEHRVYDQNFNLLGSLPPLDGLSFLAGIASVISPDGNRAYTYNSSTGMLRVLDLTTPDGSGGFVEIGTGTLLPDNAGLNPKMTISADGGTIIIAGNINILVVPAP